MSDSITTSTPQKGCLTDAFVAFVWTESAAGSAGGQETRIAHSNIPEIARLKTVFADNSLAIQEVVKLAQAAGIPEERIIFNPRISGYEELLELEAI
jgi:hypothetical protein